MYASEKYGAAVFALCGSSELEKRLHSALLEVSLADNDQNIPEDVRADHDELLQKFSAEIDGDPDNGRFLNNIRSMSEEEQSSAASSIVEICFDLKRRS